MTNASTDWLEKVISGYVPAPCAPPKTHRAPLPQPPARAQPSCTGSFCGCLAFQLGTQGPYFVTNQNSKAWNEIKSFLCTGCSRLTLLHWKEQHLAQAPWYWASRSCQISGFFLVLFCLGFLLLFGFGVFFLFVGKKILKFKIKLHKPLLLNWTFIFIMNWKVHLRFCYSY